MKTLVIVPTYNERANLPELVRGLMDVPELGVLIVDDASPDGTGQLADEIAAARRDRISVLHRRGPKSFSLSYIDGIRAALDRGASFICQMDADLSHDPADVPRLLTAAGSADLVIGSRYIPGGRIENWSIRRRFLSSFANRYVRGVTGLSIRDCTSGFRCWQRGALLRMPLDQIVSDGYAFLVELLWVAKAAGCLTSEVPITFTERREGASKMSAHMIVESAWLPWRLTRHGRVRRKSRHGFTISNK
jgi:dolichol-phosphate mannosyltransferase